MINIGRLLEAAHSIIDNTDFCREPKELRLMYWCRAFSEFFYLKTYDFRQERIPFILEILSDGECWDTTNGVTFKRRIAAKKMVQLASPSGRPTPFDRMERYHIACWCCLKEEITDMFNSFCVERGVNDPEALRTLVNDLNKGQRSNPLTIYWNHIMSGTPLNLNGMHLSEYGLIHTFSMGKGYVEAVEFFWEEILSVPDRELRPKDKKDIFMKAAMLALQDRFNSMHPEIFEFCVIRMNPEWYPELLKVDTDTHSYYKSLHLLQQIRRFDLFRQLFDVLDPDYIHLGMYYEYLNFPAKKEFSQYYASAAEELFLHIWQKEGFDSQRSSVIRHELSDNEGCLLFEALINKNYMEPLWKIMDAADTDKIKNFMTSEKARLLIALLRQRNDQYSLTKFLSYQYVVRDEPENPDVSVMEVEDPSTPSPAKRPKKE